MDYLDKKIDISGPLLPTESNCPTRVGEIVENVSDIYNIPSPRLGMQVFVKSEKKSFVVTKLKSKVINGVDVPEAAVETFELVGAKAVDADSINVEQEINGVRIDFAPLDDGAHSGNIIIPAATTESAGVMSAADKVALDNVPTNIAEAISAESKVTDNKIAAEKERAQQAENSLNHSIEFVEDAIEAEKKRATEIENNLAEGLSAELERAQQAELELGGVITNIAESLSSEISNKTSKLNDAARVDGNAFSSTANEVKLTTTGVNIAKSYAVVLPAATTEKAGVMTAKDKTRLDKIYHDNTTAEFSGETAYVSNAVFYREEVMKVYGAVVDIDEELLIFN